MKYDFHPEAEIELNEAVNYYKDRREGLGYDFSIEVYLAIQRIIDFPNAWSRVDDEKNIRRCITNRFPYGILYTIEDNLIYILAVMNLHRKPGYWKDRAKI